MERPGSQRLHWGHSPREGHLPPQPSTPRWTLQSLSLELPEAGAVVTRPTVTLLVAGQPFSLCVSGQLLLDPTEGVCGDEIAL